MEITIIGTITRCLASTSALNSAVLVPSIQTPGAAPSPSWLRPRFPPKYIVIGRHGRIRRASSFVFVTITKEFKAGFPSPRSQKRDEVADKGPRERPRSIQQFKRRTGDAFEQSALRLDAG